MTRNQSKELNPGGAHTLQFFIVHKTYTKEHHVEKPSWKKEAGRKEEHPPSVFSQAKISVVKKH